MAIKKVEYMCSQCGKKEVKPANVVNRRFES